ncbi:MAG: hydroxyacid dehydrogenase [Phycisphaerales bacterium]|nr:MAG: hydroxyacid dehydrogenase [Phycisphaerales bacterium]
MPELHVFIPRAPREAFRSTLTKCLSGRVRMYYDDDRPASFDILVDGRPREDDLTASAALRAVIIPFAGVPVTTRELLPRCPHLSFHNLHHNAAPTAEMAIGLLLSAAKRIVPSDRALRQGDWRLRYADDDTPLLEGKTAVILGYGAIGQRLARFCAAMGMRVEAVKRQAMKSGRQDDVLVHPPTALDEVLRRADVLLLALPHTSETDGLLNEARLDLLPKGCLLVNIARGAIIDERALFERLRDGHLGAAGLDVWWRYPLAESEDPEAVESERRSTPPSRFPFQGLSNVVLSPHRAGHGALTERLRAQHLADLLNAAAAGRDLPNRIDPEAGY